MTFVLFNSRSTDTVQIEIPRTVAVVKNDSLPPEELPQTVANPPANRKKTESVSLFKNNADGETVFADEEPAATMPKRKRNRTTETSDNTASAANTNAGAANDNTVNNPFYNGAAADNSSAQNNNDFSQAPPCDNPLSDKDLDKTKKKMIGKSDDDEMLSVADKAIKGKCVTTQQVKQLGSLFLSDAGRFAVYQDAYPYVSDKDNYASLQNQLFDAYFKNRFLDMLKNQ